MTRPSFWQWFHIKIKIQSKYEKENENEKRFSGWFWKAALTADFWKIAKMTLFNPLTADSIVVNLKQKDMNGIVAGSVSNILQEIPARHSSFHTIAPFLSDGIWKFLQTNFFFSIMKLFLMGLSLIVLWCFFFWNPRNSSASSEIDLHNCFLVKHTQRKQNTLSERHLEN